MVVAVGLPVAVPGVEPQAVLVGGTDLQPQLPDLGRQPVLSGAQQQTAQPPPPPAGFDDQPGDVGNPRLVRVHPHRRRGDQLTARCRFTDTQRDDIWVSQMGSDLRTGEIAGACGGQQIGRVAEHGQLPRRVRAQLGHR